MANLSIFSHNFRHLSYFHHVKDAISSHGYPEMMVLHRSIMLKLEDNINVVALLHLYGDDISVGIERIDRDCRIVHLLRKPVQMKAHYFVYSRQRIFGVALQFLIINIEAFSIQQYLFLKDTGLICY